MKDNWKLKLVETAPYLILALTLFISVLIDNSIDKEGKSRDEHGFVQELTLKPDAYSGHFR